jgi:hypothetical protein
MTRLERLLEQANPVPSRPPGHVTSDQERLLASIVASPRRRRHLRPVAMLVPVAAVVAIALVVVAVLPRGGTDDEVEATAPPPAVAAAGDAALIHVVTRLYGSVYGPGYGERLDGWLQPSTGRVRIVITTGDEITLQQVADADDHFRSWQGALGNANGLTQDEVNPAYAKTLRAEVRDRMAALIDQARVGFRQDGTTFGEATTEPGEYRGRAVTVHRIAPVLEDGGAPSGYYFKWYTDRETGEIVAFERGPVVKGRDTVETGVELQEFETFDAGDAPLHELDWQKTPAMNPFPTATPESSTTRPLVRSRRGVATPTPTPMPTGTPTPPPATPTPTPAEP